MVPQISRFGTLYNQRVSQKRVSLIYPSFRNVFADLKWVFTDCEAVLNQSQENLCIVHWFGMDLSWMCLFDSELISSKIGVICDDERDPILQKTHDTIFQGLVGIFLKWWKYKSWHICDSFKKRLYHFLNHVWIFQEFPGASRMRVCRGTEVGLEMWVQFLWSEMAPEMATNACKRRTCFQKPSRNPPETFQEMEETEMARLKKMTQGRWH